MITTGLFRAFKEEIFQAWIPKIRISTEPGKNPTRLIRATEASEFCLSQFDQRPVAANEQREVGMRKSVTKPTATL